MLVLSRKTNQEIIIGDEIKVVILEVRGDTVKLGIEAPERLSIHRKEVWAAIRAANDFNLDFPPQ